MVLLQYISMIKSLAGSLQSLASNLQSFTRRHIYFYLQDFAKNQVADYLAQSVKKKKPITV